MGYETKLYVVGLYAHRLDAEPIVGSTIATIDLSKAGQGPFNDLRNSALADQVAKDKHYAVWFDMEHTGHDAAIDELRKADNLYCFEFADMLSSEQIRKDRYDDPLVCMEIQDVIQALEQETEGQEEPYRRFMIALDLLRGIRDSFSAVENIRVLSFGH